MSDQNQLLVYPAGTVFLCENGHEVYRLTRDIIIGDVSLPEDVEPMNGAPIPITGDPVISECPLCGAAWRATDGTVNPLYLRFPVATK